jgi:hypothetical protein
VNNWREGDKLRSELELALAAHPQLERSVGCCRGRFDRAAVRSGQCQRDAWQRLAGRGDRSRDAADVSRWRLGLHQHGTEETQSCAGENRSGNATGAHHPLEDTRRFGASFRGAAVVMISSRFAVP